MFKKRIKSWKTFSLSLSLTFMLTYTCRCLFLTKYLCSSFFFLSSSCSVLHLVFDWNKFLSIFLIYWRRRRRNAVTEFLEMAKECFFKESLPIRANFKAESNKKRKKKRTIWLVGEAWFGLERETFASAIAKCVSVSASVCVCACMRVYIYIYTVISAVSVCLWISMDSNLAKGRTKETQPSYDRVWWIVQSVNEIVSC